jgi:AraC-like DNA-binding protein
MQIETHVEAVRRMQAYIDDHISEPVTLYRLAGAAGYSPYYCARLFKELTGKSPFEYIRALRLSRAALALRDEGHKVVDVALDFVFDSHEGFTRAFTKAFGITPRLYREKTPPIALFMPMRAQHPTAIQKARGEKEVKQEQKTQTVFVQVIERPARMLLLRRGIKATEYFEYCDEVGCDVWPLLCSVKEALYEPVGLWLPDYLIKPGTSKYVQGVELPLGYANEVPAGYELIELAPCRMMVFQGEPFEDDDFGDAILAVESAIDAFNPSTYGYVYDDDAAPRFQLEPVGYRGYIEARPVKPL